MLKNLHYRSITEFLFIQHNKTYWKESEWVKLFFLSRIKIREDRKLDILTIDFSNLYLAN